MVVCMSRRTCVELYKAIQKLPPAWHHDDDDKGTMKIVMSGSRIMSRIRSRGNAATELRLIEIFRAHKVTGWRRNQKLLGKPDFVFRAKRLVVFVDGCFWHGCPRCYRRPLSNLKYWDAKVLRNRQRDKTVKNTLQKLGGRVVHSLAVTGSRDRLNWSSHRNSNRALERALSRYCAPGWPFAKSASCAAIL